MAISVIPGFAVGLNESALRLDSFTRFAAWIACDVLTGWDVFRIVSVSRHRNGQFGTVGSMSRIATALPLSEARNRTVNEHRWGDALL
jgi:hypothetical protein